MSEPLTYRRRLAHRNPVQFADDRAEHPLERWSFSRTGNEWKAEAVPFRKNDESVDGDSICCASGGNRVFGWPDLHGAGSRHDRFAEREFVARWIGAGRNRAPCSPATELSGACT